MRRPRTGSARVLGHSIPLAAAFTAIAMVASAQHGMWPAQAQVTSPPVRTETVNDTVRPLSTDVWVFRLSGQQPARIAVQTQQPAALTCRVLDPAARPVHYEKRDHPCAFAWTPARTGGYRLEIHNTRNSAVPYAVVVTQ